MTDLSTLFQPNYAVLTFLMVKTFFYVELIGLLGLTRAISAKRLSALFAALAFLLALAAIAAKYLPAVANLTGQPIARYASDFINAGLLQTGDGMILPLAATAFFAFSTLSPGRRWWGLDALFALAACAFFGLWTYTLL